jgi:hypothetical protein
MTDRQVATDGGASAHADGCAGGEDDCRSQAGALARAAEEAAADAVHRIAVQAGGEIIGEQPWPGSADTIRRVSAAAGLRAAHRLELAARRQIRDYIGAARQDGRSWHEIGAVLEAGADAADRGVLVARPHSASLPGRAAAPGHSSR